MIYFIIQETLLRSRSSNNNVWIVSTFAFHPGHSGLIPCLDQQIFDISFSPSHSSKVTKPSPSKVATSGITSSSMAKKGGS